MGCNPSSPVGFASGFLRNRDPVYVRKAPFGLGDFRGAYTLYDMILSSGKVINLQE